jgi:hypothetical protein
MGLTAVSSDGSNIGDVRAVKTAPDGKVTALHIHSGGFLGFGGRIVGFGGRVQPERRQDPPHIHRRTGKQAAGGQDGR